jgi:hypothetical protein
MARGMQGGRGEGITIVLSDAIRMQGGRGEKTALLLCDARRPQVEDDIATDTWTVTADMLEERALFGAATIQPTAVSCLLLSAVSSRRAQPTCRIASDSTRVVQSKEHDLFDALITHADNHRAF